MTRKKVSLTFSVGGPLNDLCWFLCLWYCLVSVRNYFSGVFTVSLDTPYHYLLGRFSARMGQNYSHFLSHPSLNGHQSKWTCSLYNKGLLIPGSMSPSLYCYYSLSSFSCDADYGFRGFLDSFHTGRWYFSARLLKMSKKKLRYTVPINDNLSKYHNRTGTCWYRSYI